jgi:hypothetical protein
VKVLWLTEAGQGPQMLEGAPHRRKIVITRGPHSSFLLTVLQLSIKNSTRGRARRRWWSGSFGLINASQPGLACPALILDIALVYFEFNIAADRGNLQPRGLALQPQRPPFEVEK